ncbi:Hint domain-containing protein [Octadecabacter sp. 1_MG-2023]|uniref:Hint domain-containing protein n=1 Tax=unclassified Octadecabacter TaxID=196158 RepID=UPI001C09F4E5|nr:MULTISPECIES: Hint domain-containing protein [unclassified Octadecabacter]MBU2992049.1 Hint domain-containing protein [Octadecabacter sp. B2R22]MDO6736025.1 Hint domain-containing protein [Octadecabacter sp. 1_MG-2023]
MATITGTSNGDTLVGGSEDDVISGLNSQDSLSGEGGNDTLYGGDGNDTIEGGDGDDSIEGGTGQDILYGGDGNDAILDDEGTQNLGQDTVYGGAGDDTITLSGNGDIAYGGIGGDVFNVQTLTNFNNVTIDGGEDSDDGDTDVLNLAALYLEYPDLEIIYESQSADGEDGRILVKTAPNGNELGRITYTNIESIICFTAGTVIATPHGERAVETLREGDKVFTRDNGIQELRWAGRRDLGQVDLAISPDLQPVMVRAGSLGDGLPERDLMLSPNHRLLMTGQQEALYFEETEVLSAAKHLIGMPGIERVHAAEVSYLHLLFDRHEVILSNGAWSESFQPSDHSLNGVEDSQRHEIFALFPELDRSGAPVEWAAARKVLKKHEAKLLVG